MMYLRMARTSALAVLPAVLLGLTGCGPDGGGATESVAGSASPTATSAATASAAPAATPSSATGSGKAANVPEVLRFTSTTLDGKPFDAATLAGKPTVLWFWAPWCPKCRAQAAATAEAAGTFAGKANVVGVAGLDKAGAMREFVSSTKTGAFPHLSDEAGEVWKRFEVTEQSTYVFLDADGKVVAREFLSRGEGLADRVAQLVG